MAREIERKYLVRPEEWQADPARGVRYRQGYLSTEPARVVRVRTVGDKGFVTVKGLTRGVERLEYEYAIPQRDADEMLDHVCLRPLIEKVRYTIPFGGHRWEVDVFEGENAGLAIAEVELQSSSEQVDLPPWVGADVSLDPRYFNSNLIAHPYREWGTP